MNVLMQILKIENLKIVLNKKNMFMQCYHYVCLYQRRILFFPFAKLKNKLSDELSFIYVIFAHHFFSCILNKSNQFKLLPCPKLWHHQPKSKFRRSICIIYSISHRCQTLLWPLPPGVKCALTILLQENSLIAMVEASSHRRHDAATIREVER